MPFVVRLEAIAPDTGGKMRAEPIDLEPNSFPAHDGTPFPQEIFDIGTAQGEPMVCPNCVGNDLTTVVRSLQARRAGQSVHSLPLVVVETPDYLAIPPRLLGGNGLSYAAADLVDYLDGKGIDHVCGATHHPQIQGKIERWHQSMKNSVLLESFFLPADLERQIGAFVGHYNNQRYHESLVNLTPADVYYGRGAKFLKMKKENKKQTIRNRRLQHQFAAA